MCCCNFLLNQRPNKVCAMRMVATITQTCSEQSLVVILWLSLEPLVSLAIAWLLESWSIQKRKKIFTSFWLVRRTELFLEMVFCYQNCSDLLWDKIVLVIEKNVWNSIIEITRTIYSNSEWSEQFLVTRMLLKHVAGGFSYLIN